MQMYIYAFKLLRYVYTEHVKTNVSHRLNVTK